MLIAGIVHIIQSFQVRAGVEPAMSSPDNDNARLLEAMIETSRQEALNRADQRNAEPSSLPNTNTPSPEPSIDLFDLENLKRKFRVRRLSPSAACDYPG